MYNTKEVRLINDLVSKVAFIIRRSLRLSILTNEFSDLYNSSTTDSKEISLNNKIFKLVDCFIYVFWRYGKLFTQVYM